LKITDVTYESYRWPKQRVFSSGRGRGATKYTATHLSLVFIHTDEGITGVGAGRSVQDVEILKPVLIGQDPMCHELLRDSMYNGVFRGHKYVESISTVDIALWDLKAKVAGLPLYKLLGGRRKKLECYVAGGYYAEDKTIADLQTEMENYLSWGVKAVKMKVGGLTPFEDALRVKAVREAIGSKCKLLIDANEAWKWDESVEFAKRVEEFFPFWFEEPCSHTNLEGFRQLHAHTVIPLAAGESVTSKYEQRDLIDSGAISFVQPDAVLCGGVTEVVKIGAYADTHNIWIAPHGIQQVHVHLNCAMPNATITEFYPPQFDRLVYDAYKHPVKINADGTISPPENPGASFDIVPEALAPYRVG
jgi:L-alanine-DL-glutamate epimerase-like enolase superfamily enzyme